MEESFLRRNASRGGSFISTTCSANRHSTFAGLAALSRCSSSDRLPTKVNRTSGNSTAAASAAGTQTEGPQSPLMASMAM